MRILFLSHRVPYPPDKGEKIRAFHLVRLLGRKHEIHLFSLSDCRSDLDHAQALREHCADVALVHRHRTAAGIAALGAVATGRSLSVAAFRSRRLQGLVDDALARVRPDAVLIYTAVMSSYLRGRARVPVVLDFVDVDSEKWRAYAERARAPLSLLYRAEASRLSRFESAAGIAADVTVVISETEAALLRGRGASIDPAVVTAGVDLEYFRPSADAPPAGREPVVVFVGVMDYPPNVDAVEHFVRGAWTRVRRARPDAAFHIVGRRPVGRVRRLAAEPGVKVTGEVPDVRPYLRSAAAGVAPFQMARGVQSKILEAMASGLPVIGTPVAFQGIAAGAGDGVEVAADEATFAELLLRVLNDPRHRSEQGRRARAYVERHHRWEDQARIMEALLVKAQVLGADRDRS